MINLYFINVTSPEQIKIAHIYTLPISLQHVCDLDIVQKIIKLLFGSSIPQKCELLCCSLERIHQHISSTKVSCSAVAERIRVVEVRTETAYERD